MASLNFNLKKSGNVFQIMAVIRHRKDIKRKYTGKSIEDSSNWNPDKQRVKSGKHAATINELLGKWEDQFAKYVRTLEESEREPSIANLYDVLGSEKMVITGYLLNDAFNLFLENTKVTHQESTRKRYEVMQGQVQEFEKIRGSMILLSEIDKPFYLEFIEFLIDRHNNINKTINRKIKTIKTVMQHAFEEGWIKHQSYMRKVSLKDIKANRFPLNAEERKLLWDYHTTNLLHRKIADAFLVAMYTGLRFGDLEQFSAVHLRIHEGFTYINLNQEKMLNQNSIVIPDFIMPIIDRYTKSGGLLFDLPHNSEANKILKRIAKSQGLNREVELRGMQGNTKLTDKKQLHELISFHFARYTCTHIQDTGGLQGSYMQENLGHTDYRTTQGYRFSDQVNRMKKTKEVMVL
jgi:site-specific recombinase XerD